MTLLGTGLKITCLNFTKDAAKVVFPEPKNGDKCHISIKNDSLHIIHLPVGPHITAVEGVGILTSNITTCSTIN